MRAPLSLAVAQPQCAAHEVGINAATHAAAIRAAGARVVVFPELSLTGYESDAQAVDCADARLAPIIEACADTGSLALVGAPVPGAAGATHIAMLVIDAERARVAYRKMCVAESESPRFAAGPCPAVLEVDGWRLGLGICKDTGVREHAAETAALGIDAYVGSTLMAPDERDEQDARARRIATEHAIFVAFASFAGPTGGGYSQSAGCSGVWASTGEVLDQVGPVPGSIARALLI
jgi:predicted amidohydrolase